MTALTSPRTFAVETSCDETAVAVLAADGAIEVNLLSSQIAAHAPFGGVVPELASREHLKALPLLAHQALEQAGPVELVAVTAGPGLIGALLVGVRFAAAFAWASGLPLAAVDHLDGHQVSPFLDLEGGPARPIPDRVLSLVASGGHSSWYLSQAREQAGSSPAASPFVPKPERLCRTRDDAAGEAFDKVAQAIGLPYPGGPEVDRLARLGSPGRFELPRARTRDGSGDLSFSGLKSAAIRIIRQHQLDTDPESDASCDFMVAFETAVVDQLLAPLPALVARHRPLLITASGGVAANTALRERLRALSDELSVEVLLPPRALTTDNAAMIARAGQMACARGELTDPRRLDAHARKAWQPPGMRRRGPAGVEPPAVTGYNVRGNARGSLRGAGVASDLGRERTEPGQSGRDDE